MTIRTEAELEGMRRVGRVVGETLRAMRGAARVGVTTGELDAVAARVLARHGARSAPAVVYAFPGAACISVGDEVVHGVPGDRVLVAGDLVKLDVTAELDGWMADAAVTVVVGDGADGTGRQLSASARSAFREALAEARPGRRVSRIGRAIEREAGRRGHRVVKDLCGHGIGRTIHEPPQVPNFDDPRLRDRLEEGMVITIEPLVTTGDGAVELAADGWTYRTRDRTPVAHHEHTLVVTRRRPILLTAA